MWRGRRRSAERSTYQQSIWHAARPLASSPEHKVILLGMAGVGKTSFFLRVRDGVFRAPAEPTYPPADYLVKNVRVSRNSTDERSLKIVLYDTAGGEKFRTLTSNYFQNAHAGVLMFSVDDELSFYKMELEVENARPFLDRDFSWVVVGNKSDLTRDPQISEARVEAFCAQLGTTLWFYTSVKTGDNVEQVLETVASELYRVRHGSMCMSVGSYRQEHSDTVELVSVECSTDDDKPGKRGCKTWQCNT